MEKEMFINWLNEKLEEKGWLASELARRSGVSQAQISLVCSGQRNPGPDFLRDVALALGEDPVKLFRMTGYLPEPPPQTDLSCAVNDAFRQLDDTKQDAIARIVFDLAGDGSEIAPAASSRPGQGSPTEKQRLDARALWDEVVFEMEYCGQLLLEGWTDRAEGERHFLNLQTTLLQLFWTVMDYDDQAWSADYTRRLLNAYRRYQEQHEGEGHRAPIDKG